MTATLTRPVARCATSPDRWAWFSTDPDAQEYAIAVCGRCALVDNCLRTAVTMREHGSVRGGKTPAELRALIASQPKQRAGCGTNSRYIGGCRCPKCRHARARYVARWRANRRVTASPKVVIAVLDEPAGRGHCKAWPGQTFFAIGPK